MLVTRCAIHGRGGFFKMSEAESSIIEALRKHNEMIERENQQLRLENIRLNLELIKEKNKTIIIPVKDHPMMRAWR